VRRVKPAPSWHDPAASREAKVAQEPEKTDGSTEEAVPFFGTWRVAYAAVLATAVLTLVLLLVFQEWRF
jgi:anti-sigma-K factor RskA